MTDWTQVPDPEFTAEYLAINAEMGRRRTPDAHVVLVSDHDHLHRSARGGINA